MISTGVLRYAKKRGTHGYSIITTERNFFNFYTYVKLGYAIHYCVWDNDNDSCRYRVAMVLFRLEMFKKNLIESGILESE